MKLYIYIIIILLTPAIWSCRSVRYVPVETVKHDSVYFNKVVRDSIHVKDSVYVRDKGDTLYVERWKYLYRDKVRVDTMVSVRVDTLAVPYPVEKRLTRWEQFRLDVGGYAIFAVVVTILIAVGYMIYKLKKGG